MLRFHTFASGIKVAEVTEGSFKISTAEDCLDLLADAGAGGCDRMVVYESSLPNDFFNLRTRLAGEILQKFSNYRARLAIVGDFSKYQSKSLQDFIRECNRGRQISFVNDLDEGLSKLSG